jgi:hypothetical protein
MNHNITYQTIFCKQIYLNSSLANTYLNGSMKSSVIFYFNEPIKADRTTIETRVSVCHSQFPVSWYLINNTNNKIYITINSVQTIYYFPNGNYDVNLFISTWISYFGNLWSITFNNITNKFTFSNTTYDFTFSDNKNSIFRFLGLISGYSYTSSGKILTSVVCVNFCGLNTINVSSSTFNVKNYDSYNDGCCNTIASIPCNAPQNGIIFYNNYTGCKSIFKSYGTNQINIDIMDDNENHIDFNNADWSICLQIDKVDEVEYNNDTLEDVYVNVSQENI